MSIENGRMQDEKLNASLFKKGLSANLFKKGLIENLWQRCKPFVKSFDPKPKQRHDKTAQRKPFQKRLERKRTEGYGMRNSTQAFSKKA